MIFFHANPVTDSPRPLSDVSGPLSKTPEMGEHLTQQLWKNAPWDFCGSWIVGKWHTSNSYGIPNTMGFLCFMKGLDGLPFISLGHSGESESLGSLPFQLCIWGSKNNLTFNPETWIIYSHPGVIPKTNCWVDLYWFDKMMTICLSFRFCYSLYVYNYIYIH